MNLSNKNLNPPFFFQNENQFPFNSTLGILNNCARNSSSKDVYTVTRLRKKDGTNKGKINMVELLEELLKTDITCM